MQQPQGVSLLSIAGKILARVVELPDHLHGQEPIPREPIWLQTRAWYRWHGFHGSTTNSRRNAKSRIVRSTQLSLTDQDLRHSQSWGPLEDHVQVVGSLDRFIHIVRQFHVGMMARVLHYLMMEIVPMPSPSLMESSRGVSLLPPSSGWCLLLCWQMTSMIVKQEWKSATEWMGNCSINDDSRQSPRQRRLYWGISFWLMIACWMQAQQSPRCNSAWTNSPLHATTLA